MNKKKRRLIVALLVSLLVISSSVSAASRNGSGRHGSWDYDWSATRTSTRCQGTLNFYPEMLCRVTIEMTQVFAGFPDSPTPKYVDSKLQNGSATIAGYPDWEATIRSADFSFYFGNAILFHVGL